MSKLWTFIIASFMAVTLLLLVGVASVSAREIPDDEYTAPLAPLQQAITVTLGSDTIQVGGSIAITVGLENPSAIEVAAFRMETDHGAGNFITVTNWSPNVPDFITDTWWSPAGVNPGGGPTRVYWSGSTLEVGVYITGTGSLGWLTVDAGMTPGTYELAYVPGAGLTALKDSGNNNIFAPALGSPSGWITVVDIPITSLSAAGDSPVALGTATNFTATVNGAATNVTYTWSFGGTGTGSGLDTANPAYTYDNPGVYTAIVTASNTADSITDTTTVEIHALPDLSADNSGLTDVDSDVYFTATLNSDPLGVTYVWDFGDGVGTDVGATPSYAYSTAGSYVATVTATNAAGSVPATTTVDIQDVLITGLAANNDGPTALGSPTQFNATVATGTGVSYAWDFGDGTGVGVGASPVYTYTGFGTFTAVVTATNSRDWVTATTDVIISSDPDIQVPASMTEVLNPNETSTQILTIRNVGGENLNWSTLNENPGVGWLSETPTSGSAPIPPGGSDNVTVTFNSTGMNPGTYNTVLRIRSDDPDEQWSNVPVTLTVTCVPVTAVDFDYTPSNPSAGDPVDLTAVVTPSNATPLIDYAWNFGDGDTGAGPTVAHTWSLSGTYSVALTVTNCSGVGLETVSKSVNVPGDLDITVSPPSLSATLNPGSSITRTLVIENDPGATANLNWNLAENPGVGWLTESSLNGTLGPGESVNVDVVFDATGWPTNTYTTWLQVNSNDPDEPQVIVTATLVVTTVCIPAEGANFSYSPSNPQAGEEVTFFGSVTRGTEPVTYTWDFGGGNVATGSVVTYSWNLSGTYPVAVSAVNSCGSTGPTTNYVGVTGEPDITVAPLTLSASLEVGGNTTRQLIIGNDSAATADLNWSVMEVPTDVAWLSEAPGSGVASPGMSDTVTISFNAVGLSGGTYNTTLRVGSNDPDQPTVDVPVALTVVTCAPVSNVDFTTSANPEVGEPVTFTGTVDAGSRTPIEFAFDFGDGTAPVSTWRYENFYVVQHTYTASDTYHVVMTATNNCPSDATVTHDVVVPGDPDIAVDPLSLSALLNPNINANQTSPRELIIRNAAGATAGLRWTLVETPTDVSWLDVSPASGLISPSGSSSVQVTFNTSPNPGFGTHTTTLRITSNDLEVPVVNVNVTLEVASGCIEIDGADFDFAPTGPITAGDTVVFTASVEQGSLPIDYTWDFGDGNSVVQNAVNAQTSIVTHIYTGTEEGYHVKLRVTNPCPSEDSVSKRVGNPVIYLPLVVRNHSTCAMVDIIAPLESDSPVALGEMMHFTATVAGSIPITYAWEFGGSGTSGGTDMNPNFTYDAVGTYTVTLVVTNACGTDDESIVVSVITPTCTVPSITGLTSDGSVTLGETVHFTTAVTGSTPITYTWDFGGAGTQGGTDANPTFTYDAAGIYVVRLDVANPCGTDTDVTLVTVNATRSSSSFVPAASLADAMLSLISRLPAFDAIVEADASQPAVDSGDASG